MSKTSASAAQLIPALVAGTGHGLRVIVPALRASGFEVVGLVGNDPARTQRRAENAGIAGAYTDLDTAIVETGAQAVAIATPPNTHAALVHTAVARGCHVLCEKPFARDANEAAEMLAAAERAGVVHLMGNQFRMMPERVVMARAIADGLIGEPRLVTITQYSSIVANPDAKMTPWWFDTAAGGGWLGASGSHMVDMIRTWLGDFDSLSASVGIVADRSEGADDTYLMRFTLASGVPGLVMQTGGAWGGFAAMTRIAGTHGTLSMENGKVFLADRNGTRELSIPDELLLPHQPPSDDPRKQYLHVEIPPARRLCEIWRDAIAGKPPKVPVATFADGLAAMKVIDAIRASAAAGGALVTL